MIPVVAERLLGVSLPVEVQGRVVVPVWVVLEGLRGLSRSRATSVPQVDLFWFHQLAGSKVCLQEARGGGCGGEEEGSARKGCSMNSELEKTRGVRTEHYPRD